MCHPPEVKAAAMAALLEGQSVCAVAKKYDLPKGTVSSWKTRFEGDETHADFATQKAEIGELLMTLVKAQLNSAIKRVELFGDMDYLKKQPASELATLHGVDLDKVVRLLEAFSAGDDDSADGANLEPTA